MNMSIIYAETENQAARIWVISGIVLDYLTSPDTVQNIIDRDTALTQSFESVLRDHNIIHILTEGDQNINSYHRFTCIICFLPYIIITYRHFVK